jgi:hypothetical protein
MEKRRTGSARFHGDAGAVLIEAALVTPVFVLLIFGIVEWGGAFRDYLTLSNGTSAGARTASIQGSAMQADWELLQAIKRQTAAMPRGQIQMIVVFKASGPSSVLPEACKTSGQTVGSAANPGAGSCNRYSLSDLNLTSMPSSWSCTSGPTRHYCPTARKTAVNDPPDYLGVYIEARHPFVTGLFGDGVTLSSTTITKLEPNRVSS